MTNEELDEIKEDVEEAAGAAEEELDENAADDGEAEKAAKELSAVKDQLLRTMAEYDNFRKRSAREKDALRAEIVTNVTSKFLHVLDNLELSLKHISEPTRRS